MAMRGGTGERSITGPQDSGFTTNTGTAAQAQARGFRLHHQSINGSFSGVVSRDTSRMMDDARWHALIGPEEPEET